MADDKNLERLFELLPDYVRGDLPTALRQDFEAALEQSPELQRGLQEEQMIAAEIRAEAASDLEEMKMSTDKRFDELSKRIVAEEAVPDTSRTQSVASSKSASIRSPMSFLNPRNWKPAVALSVFAMGMSGVAAAQALEIDRLEEENYQLASGCEDNSEAVAIVEFSEAAAWPEIVALLAEQKLSIIKSGAFGAVELGKSGEGEFGAAQLETLRASPLVANADAAQ